MRVAVTGANGFIGKYVVKELLAADHEVIGLDLLPPGPHPAYLHDVDITEAIDPIAGLDAVIHLAARSHPRQCDEDPRRAYDVNVNGTSRVLQFALKSGARKVVFSSSAHVYGISPRYLPTDENHPLWLQNTYTTTKIIGEQLCELYYANHGLSYTVLRLFNAYGKGQALGYFVPDILAKAQAGQVTLSGGNTTKDWVYVEDVAKAFVLALATSFVGTVNIGTGIETDLASIAAIIAHETGAKFSTSSTENATRMCANNERARRVLGWSPTVRLSEGLNACLDTAKVKEPV